jgi:hypothetical protein
MSRVDMLHDFATKVTLPWVATATTKELVQSMGDLDMAARLCSIAISPAALSLEASKDDSDYQHDMPLLACTGLVDGATKPCGCFESHHLAKCAKLLAAFKTKTITIRAGEGLPLGLRADAGGASIEFMFAPRVVKVEEDMEEEPCDQPVTGAEAEEQEPEYRRED